MAYDEDDPEAKTYLSGFTAGLAELGWTNSRNLHVDVRWAAGNVDRMRMSAKELLDLQPDVILAQGCRGTPATAAFQRAMPTIPIVFAGVADPVANGTSRGSTARAGTSPASPPSKPRWEVSGSKAPIRAQKAEDHKKPLVHQRQQGQRASTGTAKLRSHEMAANKEDGDRAQGNQKDHPDSSSQRIEI
jgi:hypothetical protein